MKDKNIGMNNETRKLIMGNLQKDVEDVKTKLLDSM